MRTLSLLLVSLALCDIFSASISKASGWNDAPSPRIRLILVGDIDAGADLSSALKGADVAYAQLDLTDCDRQSAAWTADRLRKLRKTGVRVVSFRNREEETEPDDIAALTGIADDAVNSDLQRIGVGSDEPAAREPALLFPNPSMRLAFLGYRIRPATTGSATADGSAMAGGPAIEGGFATLRCDANGVLRPEALRKLSADLRSVARLANRLVLSLDWETMPGGQRARRSLARRCIDDGADLVVGASSQLQGFETYKKKAILYGTGQLLPRPSPSGVFRVDFDAVGIQAIAFQPAVNLAGRCRFIGGAVAAKECRLVRSRSAFLPEKILPLTDRGASGFLVVMRTPEREISDLPVDSGESASPPPPTARGMPPADFVRVEEAVPGIVIDLRYATADNPYGHRFYREAECYLRRGTALKLRRALEIARGYGVGLKIWDAYRPWRVQLELWSRVPDSRWIANPYAGGSNHNRGAAVDLTLIDSEGGDLEMPTGFDAFSPRAYPSWSGASSAARRHRALLRKIMTQAGFRPITSEWWHFDDADVRRYGIVKAMGGL
jgi:D-alanyl-D-alanine dipeptidase